MKTRQQLEHLEQTDPLEFQRELEKYAAGQGKDMSDPDVCEGVAAAMIEATELEAA